MGSFAEPGAQFRIPGYTGHVKGMYDTIGVTPGHAQYKAQVRGFSEMDPTWSAAVPHPSRDPCNVPEKTFKKHPIQHELWPSFANEFSIKANHKPWSNKSNIVLGDDRFFQGHSHYNDVHADNTSATGIKGIMNENNFNKVNPNGVPVVRLPKKFSDLSKSEIMARYTAIRKTIDERTMKSYEANMRLRLAAKMTNDNVNGQRMNRMFQQFDGDGSGYIELEEFHKGLLSYGIQLDIEQCLRLFAEFDEDGNGFLSYTEFMKEMLEEEYFKLSFRFNQAETSDERKEKYNMHLAYKLKQKLQEIKSVVLASTTFNEMESTFRHFDIDKSGFLSSDELAISLRELNVHLLPAEKQAVFDAIDVNKDDKISYQEFVNLLTSM